MNLRDTIAVAVIALCTLLIFCFSLAETAIMSMSNNRLRRYAPGEGDEDDAQSSGSSDSMRRLLREPTRVVATVQIGLTVFSLTSVAVAVSMLSPDVAHWLGRLGVRHNIRTAVSGLVVIVTLLTLVVGEIVPRAVALRFSERIGTVIVGPLCWAERLARPIVALVLALSNALVKPFGMNATFRAPIITEEELRTVLETSQKEGVIQEDEKEMLHNVISFGDTLVHKVMTPRVLIRAIEAQQPLDKLINQIIDHGHSRIPIYEQTIDNIAGVIHAKDILPSLARGYRIKNLRSITRAPFFVPEQMRTDELLDEMRRSNRQLAIVQDEYGGTAGLVTIEDLLEEIVGEIRDEYDVEQPQIEYEEGSDAVLVDARADIEDINEELDLSLSTTDFDTIGGFVFGLFGRPPLIGDSIDTIDGPDHNIEVRFTITKADGRRLQQIRIETKPYVPPTEEEDADEENTQANPATPGSGK